MNKPEKSKLPNETSRFRDVINVIELLVIFSLTAGVWLAVMGAAAIGLIGPADLAG